MTPTVIALLLVAAATFPAFTAPVVDEAGVVPDTRRVEVLTAPDVSSRVPDTAAQQVVDRMTERFAAGDLGGGVLAGIAEIVAAAGPGDRSGEEVPDFLQG